MCKYVIKTYKKIAFNFLWPPVSQTSDLFRIITFVYK
jgi:hypothetical protein